MYYVIQFAGSFSKPCYFSIIFQSLSKEEATAFYEATLLYRVAQHYGHTLGEIADESDNEFTYSYEMKTDDHINTLRYCGHLEKPSKIYESINELIELIDLKKDRYCRENLHDVLIGKNTRFFR